MLEKSCSRSQGHPVPGVRSAAMISMRRAMSREGVMRAPDRRISRRGRRSTDYHALARRRDGRFTAGAGHAASDTFNSHKTYYGTFIGEVTLDMGSVTSPIY